MNKERLLKLADLLKQDAANPTGVKFDLTYWVMTPSTEVQPSVSCDTQACAVGLACLSGIFNSEGLGYVLERDGPGYNIHPTFEGSFGWRAVQKFFNVSEDDVLHLFSSSRYAKITGAKAELEVVKRIEKMVADN